MVDRDGAMPLTLAECAIEHLADGLTEHANPHLYDQARPTSVIDDGQDPKWPTVGESIMRETHTLPFLRAHRNGNRPR